MEKQSSTIPIPCKHRLQHLRAEHEAVLSSSPISVQEDRPNTSSPAAPDCDPSRPRLQLHCALEDPAHSRPTRPPAIKQQQAAAREIIHTEPEGISSESDESRIPSHFQAGRALGTQSPSLKAVFTFSFKF